MVSSHSLYICFIASSIAGVSNAFQSTPSFRTRSIIATTALSDATSDVEEFLAANYPSSSYLFAKSGDVMKGIIKAEVGFTIFAPNEAAFAGMGDKKREQLEDVRNDELTGKIAGYHVILEPVTADQIFNSGGVLTEGGEVAVERSISGGFLGVGGKEDGGVTLNGAKVVKSYEFPDATKMGIIHEVDGLVSPSTLWRYADQLRIPGSS